LFVPHVEPRPGIAAPAPRAAFRFRGTGKQLYIFYRILLPRTVCTLLQNELAMVLSKKPATFVRIML